MKSIRVAASLAGVALSGLLVTGCNFHGGSLSGTCDANGNCSGTLHANSPSAHALQNTSSSTPAEQPVTSTPTTAAPATSVAAAPTTAAPTVTETQTVVDVIQSCLPNPSQQTLMELANSQQYDLQIANCLGVNDPSSFAQQLQESAVTAYETGQGGTTTGVQDWVADPGNVKCPNGKYVASVTSLYHKDT